MYALRMERPFVAVNLAVLTVSDTRTLENDTSGQYIVERFTQEGHRIVARTIVKDTESLLRDLSGSRVQPSDSHYMCSDLTCE